MGQRPKIALVLGGGGAKGAAHIGVLRALEEMRVPVDIVIGTSMGAYVGGLYATGMSADEIEAIMMSVDWNAGYQDRVTRSDRRVRDKAHEDRYNLSTDLGFDLKSFKTPKGVVLGQSMQRILRTTSDNLPAFPSFDDLVIPYRSVATDVVTMTPVVLGSGHIADAMLASMSVPGALPPVQRDNMLLVDGGVVNNMPVDVAKSLGADFVIAVDISTDYSELEQLNSSFTVMNQLINFMVRNSTAQQIALMTDDDVLLTPQVGDMETTEFDRMGEALEKGYKSAQSMADSLMALSLSGGQYQRYIDRKQQRRRLLQYGDTLVIDKVVLNNQTELSDQVLMNRLNIKTGALDTKKLEASVQHLYALDRFETVNYRIEQENGSNILQVDVREKSWGPNFTDFRFAMEDDFSSDTNFSLGVSVNSTGLSDYGAELRTSVEIGTEKLAATQLFMPFTADQQFFSSLGVAYHVTDRDQRLFEDEPSLEDTSNYFGITALTARYHDWVFEGALGWQPALWSEFKVGARYYDSDIEVLNSSIGGDYKRRMVFAGLTLDTLDNKDFPRKGHFLSAEYAYSYDKTWFDGEFENDETAQFDVTYQYAKSFDRHTLASKLNYGVITSRYGGLTIQPKDLGGFLNLSGLSRNALTGNNRAFGSLVYRYRLLDNDFGVFRSPVYLGASLEHGGVWNNPDISFSDVPLYTSGSVFAGVDSPFGPIFVSYGRTENYDDSFYVILGSVF